MFPYIIENKEPLHNPRMSHPLMGDELAHPKGGNNYYTSVMKPSQEKIEKLHQCLRIQPL